MIFILLISSLSYVEGNLCGPEGYYAYDLLSPKFWYVDLKSTECPPISQNFINKNISVNESFCRIYFNLCNDMSYQCAGTVCARYLKTLDYVIILGESSEDPFNEGLNSFEVSYQGEELPCAKGMTEVETKIKFSCNQNATWNTTAVEAHGGAKAPQPFVSFDQNSCQYSLIFNYSNACQVSPKNEKKSTTISNGSFILMLVIPGFALYMLLGVLFNLARGKKGKFVIPHLEFWVQLPDLIMDGFAFTMATITCRHEDRFPQEYQDIE